MPWIVLVGSGLLEVGWAVLLPRTDGFTRPAVTVAVVALLAASMFGLSVSTRQIPIGTAYAVWVGIGAVGTVLVGALWQRQPIPLGHGLALAALVLSIGAVKATAAH